MYQSTRPFAEVPGLRNSPLTEDVSATIDRENFPGYALSESLIAIQLAGGLAVQFLIVCVSGSSFFFRCFHKRHGDSRHATDDGGVGRIAQFLRPSF